MGCYTNNLFFTVWGDNIDQGQNSPVNIVPPDIVWGTVFTRTSDWIVLAVLAIYFTGSSIHTFYACCYRVSAFGR